MIYLVDDILRDVRVTLEENETSNELLKIDANTLALDTLIKDKIIAGAQYILSVAPMNMIDTEQSFADSDIEWYSGNIGDGAGVITLPNDFMRFVMFKMSDWKLPVVGVISDTSVDYLKQFSPCMGIRGNINRPKCAITKNNKGRALEFFSCSGGDGVTIQIATYIPYPFIIDGTVNISEQIYQSTIYQIAGLVASTYKDSAAQSLFALATSQIQIENSK